MRLNEGKQNQLNFREMKQTAVEWLIEKQIDAGIGFPKEWREQAKAMEKEQIEDAFQAGKWDWNQHITKAEVSKDLTQYYNETYGQP